MEALEFVYPFVDQVLNKASFKGVKSTFDPLREGPAEPGSYEPQFIERLKVVLDDSQLGELGFWDTQQGFSLVD